MDITPYLDLRIAPRAVFDSLEDRKSRVRFMVPTPPGSQGGDWKSVTWGAFAQEIREIALFHGTFHKAGDRGAVYAPNRVVWGSDALAIQAAGGVIVPIYPASTSEQAAYVASHSDAKVIFVDTAGLLGRLFGCWSALAHVERIVVLDDGLDVARVHASTREKGVSVPAYEDVERKVISFSRARAIGADEDKADPKRFERTMHSVSLDQPGLMLYTSGTSGNPKGDPLTHRNVGVNGGDWLKNNADLL
jgi:long-chain acyl-CoA synthetase